MSLKKNRYSAAQKVKILREHLDEQAPIAQLSEKYHIQPTVLYKWKKELYEGALDIFSRKTKKESNFDSKKIIHLESKLKQKDSLISELVEENIGYKKKVNGEY